MYRMTREVKYALSAAVVTFHPSAADKSLTFSCLILRPHSLRSSTFLDPVPIISASPDNMPFVR